ncbi:MULTISPECIES: acyl-CoA synthetase [Rhodococcus]|uniref:Acyl-CoA synthetase n=1 Tax=Rhodococcus oxybenzonivorans TaxID=1990687 RepID=A0AAE4V055_9NOCA|nr:MULTISPECIES: acyl-CoA synthetase [Rhodococcus]MDV7241061.1 acyl-CoA synthetase [Rhodococcus oxybenzonivorans]MDV7266248.1 acyl-CoA synthetase [Rhodococcus oxybenzonivorans]MDV7273334.1 acyl-CoA synthetase [Rhodococcus oxybenzonivorans]MDV7332928.1 acyl-CoA synthetase [Rhodococcus oxybenzonivorans]MDV7342094.1 acyl-CoA synthetase [Rhodococcus oxybenzonivorans]
MAYNLADLFEHSVDAMPDRVALIAAGRRITYRELEDRANRLAHNLLEAGLTAGSHIGVHLHNSIETVETLLAAFKIRAVPININYRYTSDELAYVYGNADLEAVVHHRVYSPRIAEVLPSLPKIRYTVVVEDDLGGAGVHSDSVPYEEALSGSGRRDFGERSNDDVFIMYTGGTTGRPKGVVWTHESIWRVLAGGLDFYTGEAIEDEYQQSRVGSDGEPTLWFALPPLIHAAAMMPTLTALFSGNTVLLESKFDPHRTWELVERHRVQILIITGDAMGRPLIEARQSSRTDTSSLAVVASGAALFSPVIKDAFLEEFPNLVVSDSIGASETGFGGIGFATKGQKQVGGPRVPAGRYAMVIGDDDRPIEPGSGKDGWFAKGGYVPRGYYNDPEKTREIFREVDGKSVVVTGDRARIEEDGSITLLGRGNMVINTGGEKVFAEEVESAVKAYRDVYDAIVIGVPDERWGHRVSAVVQPRDGAGIDFDGLEDHVRQSLAGYKIPRLLWVEDAVQRTPSGKPDYRWAQGVTKQRDPDHRVMSG